MITLIMPLLNHKQSVYDAALKSIQSVSKQFKTQKYEFLTDGEINKYVKLHIHFSKPTDKPLFTAFKERVKAFKFVSFTETNAEYKDLFTVAIEKVETDYVSFIEPDDYLKPNFLKTFAYFVNKTEFSSFDALLPLQLTEMPDRKVVFYNEGYWSMASSEKTSSDDIDSRVTLSKLSKMLTNRLTGIIFKTEKLKELKGLKKNILNAYHYEFLLRFLAKSNSVLISNKLTYISVINPDTNSNHKISFEQLSLEEKRYWYDIASKEYYFSYDTARPEYNFTTKMEVQ